ncbi:MAG: hypothetical protein PHX80_04110 [Candidatus Nanoarchaeia archaeon]|nr:hypothetical protein [Candidatus Nanoarchaeia archaeon]
MDKELIELITKRDNVFNNRNTVLERIDGMINVIIKDVFNNRDIFVFTSIPEIASVGQKTYNYTTIESNYIASIQICIIEKGDKHE